MNLLSYLTTEQFVARGVRGPPGVQVCQLILDCLNRLDHHVAQILPIDTLALVERRWARHDGHIVIEGNRS